MDFSPRKGYKAIYSLYTYDSILALSEITESHG